ncbi:MAG: cysteine peptidase family C39 domain-containing protein, partial [Pirellula sp.]
MCQRLHFQLILRGFIVALFIVSSESNCRSADAYCGVQCVFACAETLDRNGSRQFEELLTVEYVDSNKGSSASALVQGLALFQLNGSFMTNMALFDLSLSNSPIILHVRSSMVSPSYDHWIVYLGESKDRLIRVIDPNIGLTEISVAELGCRWDGSGVFVSKSTGDALLFKFFTSLNRGVFLLFSIVTTAAFWTIAARYRAIKNRGQWVTAVAIFFCLAAITGVAVDLYRNRLILDRDASGSLVASHQ